MTDLSSSLPDVVEAPRTDPVYACHSYLTKVPLGAIVPFIEAFTWPGEVIADPFAGSGMTGVAAAMLGRRAHLSDISVLGRHVQAIDTLAIVARSFPNLRRVCSSYFARSHHDHT